MPREEAVKEYECTVCGYVYSSETGDPDGGIPAGTAFEEGRQREIYNWLQYFSPESLGQEVLAAGLEVDGLYGDVAGSTYEVESAEFAVVLQRA